MNVVIRGTNSKPVGSEQLADFFESNPSAPQDGELFIGYPITANQAGAEPVDAVYVSPTLGVVVFDIVEGEDLEGLEDRQDDAADQIEIRLKANPKMSRRRNLLMDINTITFAPRYSNREDVDGYLVAGVLDLSAKLAAIEWGSPDLEIYKQSLSTLQSISSIRSTGEFRDPEDGIRAEILKRLEDSIATLDASQGQAVIETADDVQRIRGLAGSGKTIVLALKAAYLHAQHPHWNIGVTFSTRSLRDQFVRLITTFSIDQKKEQPDWKRIHVLPSWGAPGGPIRTGVYHRFCVDNQVQYHDFRQARSKFGSDALAGACAAALREVQEREETPKASFDVILVDEAQDLPPEFLRMCYQMLGRDKRLVYAYDELQTLNDRSMPSVEEIFGVKASGDPVVTFSTESTGGPKRDIILQKCYRNSRPVLTTAHSLGFGIYRQPDPKTGTGIVQMFEKTELWNEIGYVKTHGDLVEGKRVRLARTADSSPKFLEEHTEIDDLIVSTRFASHQEQAGWVADEIVRNLSEDGLRANDIIVINPDPLTTRKNCGIVRAELMKRGVQSHVAGVDTASDVFYKKDVESVTFTGIYRAKGNEAAMVYVINSHENLNSKANQATIRNRLFTAITRSKAWVRVLGVGEEMNPLLAEIAAVKEKDFALDFMYPTLNQRETMQILHRDVSAEQTMEITRINSSIRDVVDQLAAGQVFVEDLDDSLKDSLKRLLGSD